MRCLFRREFDGAALLRDHPPQPHHPLKQAVFDLTCAPTPSHDGVLTMTRWAAAELPAMTSGRPVPVTPVAGLFDYAGTDVGVWHLNFADPRLFPAYGSRLLDQDELQVLEHPLLASVREALLASNESAMTEGDDGPTPVLISGVQRRCAFETQPTRDRPLGLYGRQFALASVEEVTAATRLLTPPTRSNLIAIAAPLPKKGPYFPKHIDGILRTAFTGFRAAVEESNRSWPGAPVEVRTGFWGCGAFGGNRVLMTLLQLLAARLAGVDAVRFFLFDDAGAEAFAAGVAALEAVVSTSQQAQPLRDVVERINDCDFQWG